MDWIQWMVQATQFGAISSVNIITMLGLVTKIHTVCYLSSIQHNELATNYEFIYKLHSFTVVSWQFGASPIRTRAFVGVFE
jgi:hypothetical protein